MFEGVLTALVTPFRDGAIDERALHELVEMQITAGVDGLVPCGSTGEAATLSHDEHRRVVEVVVAATRGRVAVVAGTGSNSTREAIELTRHAKEAGADAALLISPYYNKPTPDGIVEHYAAVGREASLPLIAYNIRPHRLNIFPRPWLGSRGSSGGRREGLRGSPESHRPSLRRGRFRSARGRR
jgi:4-hydroxy-tetrahydrodipicolinate synthase